MDTAAAQLTGTYQRHEPEDTLLYQVLAEHLETFLQQARTSDHALPWYVERDLRAFLDCGILYVQADVMCCWWALSCATGL